MSKVSEKTKPDDDDNTLYYVAAIILAIAAFYIFVQSNLTKPLVLLEDTKHNGHGSNWYNFSGLRGRLRGCIRTDIF